MRNRMRLLTWICTVLVITFGLLGIGSLASAALLLDRGLPTDNLNNVAGASRSNVAWAFGDSWLVGDDFTIGGDDNYYADKVRVWAIGSNRYDQVSWANSLTFWLGQEGGTISNYAISSVTSTTYADTQVYQGSSSVSITLYQIDVALNDMVLKGDATYQFFLGSLDSDYYAFLHCSNAALSGSTQTGADGLYLYAYLDSGVIDNANIGSLSSYGYGWDKASDANVQVFGSPVPEPSTMLLLGFGLVGLAGIGRKTLKK